MAFFRELGWTLQTTGSVMQNFIKATSTTNGKPNAAIAGAARVKDTLSVYHCNSSMYHCDDIAVHYKGSFGNHSRETGILGDSANIFACDGIPQQAKDESSAERIVDLLTQNQSLLLDYPIDDFSSFLQNNSFMDIIHDAKLSFKIGNYEAYDLGDNHIRRQTSDPNKDSVTFDNSTLNTTYYVAFNSESSKERIIRKQ